MKNTTLLAIVFCVLVAGATSFLFMNPADKTQSIVNFNTVKDPDAQIVTLGMKDLNYYPNTITVKSGKPVSLSLDSSVVGCLRSFTIRDLGIAKVLRTPQETIDFTPLKKGTYTFTCSMGMGSGTLIVE